MQVIVLSSADLIEKGDIDFSPLAFDPCGELLDFSRE
jgi:hypothetical protein